jgi:SAM-dependent methyltransferase
MSISVYGFDDVGNHANMLLDHTRVQAFADAIREVVKPGDVVADIGSGTGLLAILAAKAGARRVYAVERGPLAELIDVAAADNGVSHIVTVLRGDARDLRFPEQPDVIVSETIGSFGVDEGMLGLLKTVRRRVPNAVMVPSHLDMHFGIAEIEALNHELRTLAEGLPVTLKALRKSVGSRVAMGVVHGDDVVGVEVAARFAIGASDLPNSMTATVTASRDATINAIVSWFSSQVSPSVHLASGPNAPSPSWANCIFPVDPPIRVKAGDVVEVEITPRLVSDRGTWAWQVKANGEVRAADAMNAVSGGEADLRQQLGVDHRPRDVRTVEVWAAALQGGFADVATLVARVRAAYPERYADDSDARQEVHQLLHAADQLY